jgi:hypothetical protein
MDTKTNEENLVTLATRPDRRGMLMSEGGKGEPLEKKKKG